MRRRGFRAAPAGPRTSPRTLEDIERAHILSVLERLQRQPDAGGRDAGHRSRHAAQQAEEIWLEEDYCGSIVNRIQLLPLGTFPGETLIDLSAGLRKRFGVACEVLAAEPEPAFAFNFARQQYSSTEILASLMK